VLTPFVLESARVRLEPLVPGHAGPLAEAAAADRSSYGFTWVPDGMDDARRYVAAALDHQATGRALPFAVRSQADDRIVGCTRFLDLDVFGTPPPPWPPGVGRGPEPADDLPPSVAEIGSTWFAASGQRTGINPACKLLLLGHAFDVWQVLRVTLKTDARNAASRRAIERLGALPEGVRRAHAPASDGTIRDTAYYSIVATEWPQVRDRLTAAQARGGA
jgi:N-acetyltransferase